MDPKTQQFVELMKSGKRPPCAEHLGFELQDGNADEGRVRVRFHARPEFCNPMGNVQGGFLAAMLDDAMAVAGLFKSGFTQVMPTLEMKVSYIAPAKQGEILAEGRVIRLGNSIAFLEGRLTDPAGELLAIASATAKPAPAPWAR